MPHRYFTAEVGNGRAALNGTDAHHLADVMRAKIGENVILCDAHAVEYVGTITSIQPGRVEFTVTEGYPSAAEPSVEVTLFAGYPKLGKLEDTIRHSVELGVTNVVPFFSRYCVAAPKKEEAKNERYCRVAVEAAKQCGRGNGAGWRWLRHPPSSAAAAFCPRWSFPYRILTPCATASRIMASCSSFTSAAVFRCGKFSTKNRETVQNGSPW